MEQFSLEKYLENTSRKLVTREGRLVRIICTDRKARSGNIVGLVGEDESFIYVWQNDGTHAVSGIDANDLFFADEEEELTEFEKVLEMMMVSFSNGNLGSDVRKEMPKQKLHDYTRRLLDLARKELKNNDWRQSLMSYKDAYEQGKRDALKDLPKWKYINQIQSGNHYAHIANGIISPSGYFISYDDLETLPKEE